jgi:hypothetical protein
MFKKLLAVSLLFISISVFAQKNSSVSGTVVDTVAKKSLASATISILDAADSSLVSFSRSGESGTFSVSRLAVGKYILVVTYTGFASYSKPFAITAQNQDFDAGFIPMVSNAELQGVTVVRAPVVIKGDTVEYNASSFKTKPNAAVEELFKKLPGVEVAKDGTITSNGQTVTKVLVDGKEFFANDPKLASKNLQAAMVDKVQVFDKKSDKSQFTGFDDGNSEPTINLTLKADKRNGMFGRVSAGAGTHERYEANANVNLFKKGEQLSFIGQANNTNKQNFNLMDALNFSGGGGGRGGIVTVINGFGGNNQGITAAQSAGLNYNNFKNKKLDFTSSYFYNNTNFANSTQTYRQNFVGDSTQQYNSTANSNRINKNHRINMGIDWKIDSFNSIKITPQISFQNTENFSQNIYNTNSPKGISINNGSTNTRSQNDGYNMNITALYRHKFQRIGRSFSAQVTVGKGHSENDGTQFTNNNFYNLFGGGSRFDTLNQINNTINNNNSHSINLSYTEPVSRRAIIELSGFYNNNHSTNNRNTFDFNKATQAYDIKNIRLTNNFDNEYTTSGAGLSYKENRKGWNYTLGANFQNSDLASLIVGKTTPIKQSFFNIIPNAQLTISKNRFRNFRMFYNGNTRNPSVTQLQPIDDISDPLNIKRGNPDLKQEFSNNVRINYNSFDPYTMKNMFLNLNIRQTNNAIINVDSIYRTGNRITTYENVNGNYNVNLNFSFGLPLNIGKTKAKLNFSTGANTSRNTNVLNAQRNKIMGFGINQNFSFNYTHKEWLDISLNAGVNWNRNTYSTNSKLNTNFFTNTLGMDLNFFLPKGLIINNDLDYTNNTGRAAGFNPRIFLWNASLAKTFLKNNKGELRFTVNDLLNQNKGINRDANANYIQDQTYTVLKQYFMLTFSYNLSKFGSTPPAGPARGFGGGRNFQQIRIN